MHCPKAGRWAMGCASWARAMSPRQAMGNSLPIGCTAPWSAMNSTGNGSSRSEEHTSELQSQSNLVCRLLLEKKKKKTPSRKEDHLSAPTQSRKTDNYH